MGGLLWMLQLCFTHMLSESQDHMRVLMRFFPDGSQLLQQNQVEVTRLQLAWPPPLLLASFFDQEGGARLAAW